MLRLQLLLGRDFQDDLFGALASATTGLTERTAMLCGLGPGRLHMHSGEGAEIRNLNDAMQEHVALQVSFRLQSWRMLAV